MGDKVSMDISLSKEWLMINMAGSFQSVPILPARRLKLVSKPVIEDIIMFEMEESNGVAYHSVFRISPSLGGCSSRQNRAP
jgi:hypothetical protein